MLASPALAADGPSLFKDAPANFGHAFTGHRLVAQLAGVAATAALSQSGVDGRVHAHFETGGADSWADPAVPAGYLLVPAVGGGLWLVSKIESDDRLLSASLAAFQASILAGGYGLVLKFLTGRPRPKATGETALELSEQFHPGFGHEGFVGAWPSGHTIVTAAFTTSIASYYGGVALWGVAAASTVYMGVGMTAANNGTEHWLSDTVAGALMGYAIGSSVGEGFRRESAKEESAIAFAPLPVRGGAGVLVSWDLH